MCSAGLQAALAGPFRYMSHMARKAESKLRCSAKTLALRPMVLSRARSAQSPVMALALGAPGIEANLGRGAAALWSVPVLLLLQGVFLAVFLYTGRSSVTDSSVRFAVRAGEI